MYFANKDEKGAYIDVPDNDFDFVTLMKSDDGYMYRIRGEAVDRLYDLEEKVKELSHPTNITVLEERLKELLDIEQRNDVFYLTSVERREMQNDLCHALFILGEINKLEERCFND